jgi:hypothetical protein
MILRDAVERYPFLGVLSNVLPDDCYIDVDTDRYAIRIGMDLQIEQMIARETIEDANQYLKHLPSDWYKSLHEKLVESEVNWRIKTTINRDRPHSSVPMYDSDFGRITGTKRPSERGLFED